MKKLDIVIIIGIILLSSMVDMLNNIKFFSISSTNYFYLFLVLLTLIKIILIKPTFNLNMFIFYLLFLSVGVLSVFVSGEFHFSGLQNLFVYSSFLIFIFYGNTLKDMQKIKKEVFITLRISLFIFICISVVSLFNNGLLWGSIDNSKKNIVEPRAFAMTVSLLTGIFFSIWLQYRRSSDFILGMIGILLIFFSVSRASFVVVVCLGLIVLLIGSKENVIKPYMETFIFICSLVSLIMISTLNANLFRLPGNTDYTGGSHFEVASIQINTTGRVHIWGAVFDSFLKSPYMGNGVGTAEYAQKKEHYGAGLTKYQPHNDYLRIVHDFGMIGLAFLLVQFFIWIKAVYERRKMIPKSIYYSFFSMLFVVCTNSIVNNPITYLFIMIPFAVVLGIGLEQKGKRIINEK